jgi:hypothetical protein
MKSVSKLNSWTTISSLGSLCSNEHVDETMTWLSLCEQLIGSFGPW